MKKVTIDMIPEKLRGSITLLQPGEKINIKVTSDSIDKKYGKVFLSKWERESQQSEAK